MIGQRLIVNSSTVGCRYFRYKLAHILLGRSYILCFKTIIGIVFSKIITHPQKNFKKTLNMYVLQFLFVKKATPKRFAAKRWLPKWWLFAEKCV